eukprot:6379857-Alexandrium_andersonii.AAC.1
MDLDPLTVVQAVLHSPFDRSGRLRFLVVYRHDELRIDVLRLPVEVPGPPPDTTLGLRRCADRSRSPRGR